MSGEYFQSGLLPAPPPHTEDGVEDGVEDGLQDCLGVEAPPDPGHDVEGGEVLGVLAHHADQALGLGHHHVLQGYVSYGVRCSKLELQYQSY